MISNKTHIVYLHGFASSAQTGKAKALAELSETEEHIRFISFDFNPTPQDFRFMTITGMINRLRQYLLDQHIQECILVGSSLGALVGCHYTNWYGGVKKLLFLAPALKYSVRETEKNIVEKKGFLPVFHFAFNQEIPLNKAFFEDACRYEQVIAPPVSTTIIHGKEDEVVPVQNSRDYASQYPDLVELFEVSSDHRLGDQIDFIWNTLKMMIK